MRRLKERRSFGWIIVYKRKEVHNISPFKNDYQNLEELIISQSVLMGISDVQSVRTVSYDRNFTIEIKTEI